MRTRAKATMDDVAVKRLSKVNGMVGSKLVMILAQAAYDPHRNGTALMSSAVSTDRGRRRGKLPRGNMAVGLCRLRPGCDTPLEVGPPPLGRVLRDDDGMTNGNDLGRTNNGMDEELNPIAVDVG